MKCGSTVITYWKVSKAWVHVSRLMIIKIMVLFILCYFSSCIILHATKVACEHRYRGGGCWQLFSISCRFSSTESCNTKVVPGAEWKGTAFHSYAPHTTSSWVTCMLPCLLPVSPLQWHDAFLSAILTSGRWWCSVSICYLYFRNKCGLLSCDHKAKYWHGQKF